MTRNVTTTETADGLILTEQASLCLLAIAGDLSHPVIRLKVGELTLGRHPSSEPSLAFNDSKMSRNHARLTRLSIGVYTLTDCGSKNGTWHNGEPANEQLIHRQDVIRCGNTVFIVAPEHPRRQPKGTPLIGFSAAMHDARTLIERLAPTDLCVLILGETGTGKEVTARMIHERSGRTGEFVPVNCASIPAQLVERELFGHVRGAYTGADRGGQGFIDEAEGGTLFLDEIGELPLDVQAKLLRFLDDKVVRSIGSTKTRQTDVRVLAATNRDLREMIVQQTFRDDLYARLEEATIALPALRERKEDLPLLVDGIARRELGMAFEPNADFVEAIALYDWPRNVRELAKVIKRIPVMRPDVEQFELSDLPQELADPLLKRVRKASSTRTPTKEELVQLLDTHKGNIRRIASDLQRTRKQIYRWMETHGLDPNLFRDEE